jgi:signal transduction histidine kinase
VRRRHSLGARLVGLFVLLALAVTVTFIAGTQATLRGGWQDYVRPLVVHYTDLLAAEIGTPPDVAKARALAERLPLRIRIDGPVVNWDSKPGAADDDHGDDAQRPYRKHFDAADGTDAGWRPVRLLADGHRIRFGLADVARADRPRLIGWATLGVLLLLTAIAYATVRRLLRPLKDIRAGALRFGAGDFSQPIEPRRRDELGELAGQINRMAGNLHGMLDAKRALLLAISHELRSPLTRARLNAELVAEGPERDALLRDLAEMRDLVSDLLESERLAAGHSALLTEPTELNALVAETLATQFAGRAIRTDLAAGLPRLPLDRSRMRLVLRNLLDNALRHGGDAATPPQVSTMLEGGLLHLRVRDHGPGVPAEQLALLAQAFYRPDSARQRATGGVGLGLYLCRLVAQAHGGQMLIRNAAPGLEIDITLPAP